MKRSRHLLLLVLLLLVVTGGVFATWTYGTQNAAKKDIADNTIGVEGATETERGTIAVAESKFSISFDDVDFDHTVSKNKQELKITGSNLIKFTPSNGSTVNKDINNYRVNFQLTTSLVDPDTKGAVLVGNKTELVLNWSSDHYEATLTADNVFDSIQSVALTLKDKEAYDAFVIAAKSASFTITITDDVVLNQVA